MNTNTKKAICAIYTVLITLCSQSCGCRKNECEGKHPVSAGFTVRQVYHASFVDSVYSDEGDTVLTYNSYIRFDANEEGANYRWQIGADSFTTRSVKGGLDEGSVLNATLIVDKPHDAKCFPTDDGKDTLSRRIVAVPVSMSRVLGTFEGYFEDAPNVKRTVKISLIDTLGYEYAVLHLEGFPEPSDKFETDFYAHAQGANYISYRNLKCTPLDLWWTSNIGFCNLNLKTDIYNEMELTYSCKVYSKTRQQYDDEKKYDYMLTEPFLVRQGKFKGKRIFN